MKLSLELIIFALEALTDPTAPGYLDSHSDVHYSRSRGVERTPSWKSQTEVFLQMLADSWSGP